MSTVLCYSVDEITTLHYIIHEVLLVARKDTIDTFLLTDLILYNTYIMMLVNTVQRMFVHYKTIQP